MLKPSRGVSTSLKFRAEIRPYNRFKFSSQRILTYLILSPCLGDSRHAYIGPKQRGHFFVRDVPFCCAFLCGFKNNRALERAAAGCGAGAGAAPRADAGLGDVSGPV